jgi:calcineurin-like phosphoesterase family protein
VTYFFTADEHLGHEKLILGGHRPFKSVEEMDEEIIRRHNSIVRNGDIVIHAGDFAFASKTKVMDYIAQLNGQHTFLRGTHDGWMNSSFREIWEKTINGRHIVVCHYPLRYWAEMEYGAFNLYGHLHGTGTPLFHQLDIGVDANYYFPVSLDEVERLILKPGLAELHQIGDPHGTHG